jgi:hypothetical protein
VGSGLPLAILCYWTACPCHIAHEDGIERWFLILWSAPLECLSIWIAISRLSKGFIMRPADPASRIVHWSQGQNSQSGKNRQIASRGILRRHDAVHLARQLNIISTSDGRCWRASSIASSPVAVIPTTSKPIRSILLARS